jgi:hypothetical protein
VLALSIIGFGSLAAHSLLAVATAANDLFCENSNGCFIVPFQPNIYTTLAAASEHAGPTAGIDVAIALLEIAALSLLMYLSHRILDRMNVVRALRYGWLAEFVEQARPEGRFSTAFVLTSVRNDGAHLGYEGLIENIAVNSEREITAITLLDANRFVVNVTPTDAVRTDIDRTPIDRIFLERANILNIALTVYEDEDASSDTDMADAGSQTNPAR